jgi:hypothetical protein
MADRGFGVDLTFLLRALAAVAGGSVLLEAGLHHVPAEALQLAWSKVTTAFERLVDVVRREAYVDSLGDLPSPLVLLPITVHLANHDASFSTDAEKARFLRWLFLAGVWGRYSASTESTLQRDVALLAGPDPPLALERAILAERGRLELEASDVAGKGAGSAVDKLAVVVARARGARDWFSGEALHDGARAPATGLEGHHIFPKTVLYRSGYDPRRDRGMVNEVANRVVLAPGASRRVPAAEPVAYLAEVDAAVPGALEAQSVPLDRRLWEVESYGRFLAERARLLAAHMNEFLALLAPFDRASTGGSRVADLVAGGEGATVEFKASLRWGVPEGGVNRALEQSVVKAVAGFLNSREGGTILIGVADDGMVLGLAGDYASSPALGDRDGFERHLRNLLSSAMGEAVHGFVAVTFHDLGGRSTCRTGGCRPSTCGPATPRVPSRSTRWWRTTAPGGADLPGRRPGLAPGWSPGGGVSRARASVVDWPRGCRSAAPRTVRADPPVGPGGRGRPRRRGPGGRAGGSQHDRVAGVAPGPGPGPSRGRAPRCRPGLGRG